ncbi:astacin-like metalloprotease toxin 1 [Trichonephila inaurata madagascariensis]|uniref:Metalloendopeptidase n=1 Tax=Trichonephila inaurata madagascariensis TaxID=2747483 RepID=A0A8X7CEH4_9ARAC|nr:astacin-like metalloprotease toxin 1 [Trichonephila inaurata madagascariensis]
MNIIIFLGLLTITWGFPRPPMENPDLFQGDIAGIDINDRNALPDDVKLWPNGVIPYKIDFGLADLKDEIESAMKYIMDRTCLKFVRRENREPDFIRIFSGDGCYSHWGRTGKVQPLSLGSGCESFGTIIHELTHAIGFDHEQNRSDRDDYLLIYYQNIDPEALDQFIKLKPHENRLINKFDYDSIMLYGEKTFSRDGRSKTMKSKKKGIRLLDSTVLCQQALRLQHADLHIFEFLVAAWGFPRNPMENPDLFQGDILGIESVEDRNAIPNNTRRWPGGVIPYKIDKGLDDLKEEIAKAMKHIMDRTCIKFVPWDGLERGYIKIFPGDGCYSYWGRTGKIQPVSLGYGCEPIGTIIHELTHAIGFDHEQNRSDRDEYLIIYWQNIWPETSDSGEEFRKQH